MVRVFSNDPTAFLQEEHPVQAWHEMLSLEEKATFREIMGYLSTPSSIGEGPNERLEKEVILALDFEFTKIVQVLRFVPTSRQLEQVNRRLEEYESFLSDCIHKMHGQLNDFEPRLVDVEGGWGSLEEEQSLRTHTRLKGFEEKLMQKIGNLALQIRKLSDCCHHLDQMRQAKKSLLQRWATKLLAAFAPNRLLLSQTLMRRLEVMQHNLVQDYARLGTLWRYYNQHRVLRTLTSAHQAEILQFCKGAYWREHRGGWEQEDILPFAQNSLEALDAYFSALQGRWKELEALIPNALSEGVEGDIEGLQVELEDFTITLGKYKEAFTQLFAEQDLPDVFQSLKRLNRDLHVLSADVHRGRANMHPILNELGRESKENVMIFVSLGAELEKQSYQPRSLEPQLALLFEAVEDYIAAIKDEVRSLTIQSSWSDRERKKASSYSIEIQDIRAVLQSFRDRYQRFLKADPDLQELFATSANDLNESRLATMEEHLTRYLERLQSRS